jgi:hypothetical protein
MSWCCKEGSQQQHELLLQAMSQKQHELLLQSRGVNNSISFRYKAGEPTEK